MTLQSSSKPSSTKQHSAKSDMRKSSSKVSPIHMVEQSGLQELTPLQRQRLDTAVMLLVNYLVSASSQS